MAKKAKPTGNISDDFFASMKTGDPYVDAGQDHPDFGTFSTGCYALNALLSGDIYGGFPLNNFVMLVGKKSSGKSYLLKNLFCYPLMTKLGYNIQYIETEGETTEAKLRDENGFPAKKFRLIKNVHTVEDLKHQMEMMIEQVEAFQGDDLEIKAKLAFVLDSQGMLTTSKSINDASKGDEKQDMTKAKLLTGFYRNIVGRCASLGIPMCITNHQYIDAAGAMYGNPNKISGGESSQYAGAIILELVKGFETTKDSNGKTVKTGVRFNCKIVKSRMVRDGMTAPVYIDYEKGINPYYGLHEIALTAGLIEKYSASAFPELDERVPREANGRKTQKTCYVIKDPNKDPSEWIVCKETAISQAKHIGTILDPINEYVNKHFKFLKPSLHGVADAEEDNFELDPDETRESEARIKAENEAEIAAKIKMMSEIEE